MLNFVIGQFVRANKGCKIGVKARKRLCTRPFILHNTKEVDHLIAQRRQMFCRCGGDFAGNTAESLFNELLKTPAGTVAGKHGKVVQMQIGVAVRVGDLLVIYLAEPVVCGDSSGIGENQAAHRIGHGGIFLHSPVGYLQIAVHKPLIVQYGGTHIAELFAVFTV